MELKIIKGNTNDSKDFLDIRTESTHIAVTFGEDVGTGDLLGKVNPAIDGLTSGNASYNGLIVIRNPENCGLMRHCLNNIPVIMERKLQSSYEACCDFWGIEKHTNFSTLEEKQKYQINDLAITFFIVDGSNYNTAVVLIESQDGKKIVVSGDFRDYDGKYNKSKFDEIIKNVKSADYIFIDGTSIGHFGGEYSSGREVDDKLKNIMKLYKQIFIIQSETDTITASYMYEAAQRTKKIFIETSLLCNNTSIFNGKSPSPIKDKKVYCYNPFSYETAGFDFKKKYIAPFFIHNATDRLKKDRYAMNITSNMLQDIQILDKNGSCNDAAFILAQSKNNMNEQTDTFIKTMKDMNFDYYELYIRGKVNINMLLGLERLLEPNNIILMDFDGQTNEITELESLRVLNESEIIRL